MNRNTSRRILTTIALTAIAITAAAQKENLETVADFHHIAAYLVAGLMITVFVMIFSNRVYYFREKDIVSQRRGLISQLGLVMGSNNTRIFTLDIEKGLIWLISENGEDKKGITLMDFSQMYNHDDFRGLMKDIVDPVKEGRMEQGNMRVRGGGKDDESVYDINISVLHRRKSGGPKVLLGIQQDITDEYIRKENAQKLAMRMRTVFDSSQADMIYYDENGYITDINDKACETFGISNRASLLKRKVHLNDIITFRDIDIRSLDKTTMSTITDLDKLKATDERVAEVTIRGKLYYEVSLTAIKDKEGKLLGVISAGRNITEMVTRHHQEQKNRKLLEQTTEDIKRYINNINYTLRVSGVRMVNYDPEHHMLDIASDLNKIEYRLSQIRCASLLTERERRRARGLFMRMDRRTQGALEVTLETIFRDEKGRNIYQTINMVPVKDKEGNITSYFGMARNDTEMHYTEALLEEETKKAQETEELKNTFLTNMSYEIRTPLNAVLGFAELFNGPHDEADEPVFAEEIKRNTGNLLNLINDILFISRLDAKMVEFNYNEADFAASFEGYCYMGFSMVNPGVNISVENPYSLLLLNIDEQNLGEVISKMCSISAASTKEGSIRAKCDYRHGELTISIEDTSDGMDKNTLRHIFDRFANDNISVRTGTGLELPIIKGLVEQMGGSIEVQSEQGKGTAAYVIIPCEMIKMEKK
ncbi:MAG: PAS domain S-box protein [Prevotella sp.]|nr:PAS domain S-box protein [Prevotella sp.]